MPVLGKRALGTGQQLTGPQLPAAGAAAGRTTQELMDGDAYVSSAPRRHPAANTGLRSCGADGCTSGWIAPWKNRKRPIFEEEWGCGGRCLKSMVRAAIRRESGEAGGFSAEAPHRHRVPLGLVLLAQGWISHPQLQAALEAQRTSGEGRIGDWLVQSGLAEERVTRGLGVQWSCPVLALTGFSPTDMALVMPKRFAVEFGLVPLRVAGSRLLYLGFEDRMNAAAALGIEQMSGLSVESGVLNGSQFRTAKDALLGAEAVPVTMEVVANADEAANVFTRLLETRQPIASRLVRVHQYLWMRMWLESGALSGVGRLPSGAGDVLDCLIQVKDGKMRTD